MKKKIILVNLILLSTLLFSQGTWVQKAESTKDGRYALFYFSINNMCYIGGGEIGSNNYANDFWVYDPVLDIWTQKADFGGGPIYAPISFVINDTPYVCTGTNTNNQFKKFVWVYNQQLNTWTQKNDFPGVARYGAYAFSIGSKGYLGMGQNAGALNDFWEYDPITDSWTQRTNFVTGGRYGAIGFSINGKGYAGFGSSQGNTQNYNDLYEFNPINNTWTQKASFPGQPRNYPTYFIINNEAYIGAGNPTTYYTINPVLSNDFYKFSPLTNQWTQIASFTGCERTVAASFAIGNKGYIGTGLSGYPQSTYLKDFWEYTPQIVLINENTNNVITDVRIDLINKSITLVLNDNFLPVIFKIYNISGQLLKNVEITDSHHKISINNLPRGTYIYSINSKDARFKSDKFIIF